MCSTRPSRRRTRSSFPSPTHELTTLFGNPTTAQAHAQLLLPDLMTFDTSSSKGFLNGRRLTDDVIDAELNLLTNGAVTSDGVVNDSVFFGQVPLPGDAQPETGDSSSRCKSPPRAWRAVTPGPAGVTAVSSSRERSPTLSGTGPKTGGSTSGTGGASATPGVGDAVENRRVERSAGQNAARGHGCRLLHGSSVHGTGDVGLADRDPGQYGWDPVRYWRSPTHDAARDRPSRSPRPASRSPRPVRRNRRPVSRSLAKTESEVQSLSVASSARSRSKPMNVRMVVVPVMLLLAAAALVGWARCR